MPLKSSKQHDASRVARNRRTALRRPLADYFGAAAEGRSAHRAAVVVGGAANQADDGGLYSDAAYWLRYASGLIFSIVESIMWQISMASK